VTRRRLPPALLAAAVLTGCGLDPAVPLPAPHLETERGIGGTGIDVAERGIGGTGIIGVITVDGTIAVAGQEIRMDSAPSVQIDGQPASMAALRSGQVVAVAAEWRQGRLQARAVAVRHEVSGPVERVLAAGEDLQVAGQLVRVDRTTQPGALPRRGDWVAISGLRDADGVIRASRIDQRTAGEVSVSGLLGRAGQVGDLSLRGTGLPAAGQRVSVTGDYAPGMLRVHTARADPGLPFPPAVDTFLVEAYPRNEDGRLRLSPGLSATLGSWVAGIPAGGGPVVVTLAIEGDRGLVATSVDTVGAEGRSGGGPDGPGPNPGGSPGTAGHGHDSSGGTGDGGGKGGGGQGEGGEGQGGQGQGGQGEGGHAGGGQGGGGHAGGGQGEGGESGGGQGGGHGGHGGHGG
jgi:hypothetical protein